MDTLVARHNKNIHHIIHLITAWESLETFPTLVMALRILALLGSASSLLSCPAKFNNKLAMKESLCNNYRPALWFATQLSDDDRQSG